MEHAQPIKPTLDRCKNIVPQTQPNLIVINDGSSDCFQQQHWGPAFILQKMRDLVDYLFEALPRATIVMSTIITSLWDNVERCVKLFNVQIRQGQPNRVKKHYIGKDNMHPIDAGYFIMGDIFIEAIQEADEKGFLQAPVNNGVPFDGKAERHTEEQAKSENQTEEKKPEEEVKTEGKTGEKTPEDKKPKKKPPARRRRYM